MEWNQPKRERVQVTNGSACSDRHSCWGISCSHVGHLNGQNLQPTEKTPGLQSVRSKATLWSANKQTHSPFTANVGSTCRAKVSVVWSECAQSVPKIQIPHLTDQKHRIGGNGSHDSDSASALGQTKETHTFSRDSTCLRRHTRELSSHRCPCLLIDTYGDTLPVISLFYLVLYKNRLLTKVDATLGSSWSLHLQSLSHHAKGMRVGQRPTGVGVGKKGCPASFGVLLLMVTSDFL